MIDRMMIKLLDHSKAAQPCEWKCDHLEYRKVGEDTYQTESDYWIETGFLGYAAELRHSSGRLQSLTTQDGRVEIFSGFVWDGPSGQFGPFETYDTPDSMQASLVHDDGYRKGRARRYPLELREKIDELFFKILLQNGMYRWRARRWYWAVRRFGLPSYTGTDSPIMVAR